ncbi:MAG: efflux RND transporter periplasmic adaptor subunit [Rhodospirillaceae bacterium]
MPAHRPFPLAAAILLVAMSALASSASASPPGDEVQARAVVQPHQQAMLSSEIAGRIDKLPLREGERFRKGDTLVEFDCRGYQAVQAAAKAALDHAQAKLNAEAVMAAHHSSGALEVAMARTDADKARADHRSASLAVEHCIIAAPFDGRVVERKAHAYETVAQHTPLLGILDDTSPEVALVVPATWLVWLKPGQTFTLEVDETQHSHPGKITRLGAQIDPVSQTITVFGETDDRERTFISGMSGNAHFSLNQAAKP